MNKKSKFLSYGRQSVNAADIQAVTSVLKSSHLTQGPLVQSFEEAFARYTGASYAVAVCNGTAALYLLALALDYSQNDSVITSPNTFAATANSARYCSSKVQFIDIENKTLALDGQKTTASLKIGTKAVHLVHFAGAPAASLALIAKACASKGVRLIEDACHALGAEYVQGNRTRKIGNCALSDAAVFSFHPVKHITTGEGGMITTNNKKLYQRLLKLRSHGIAKNASDYEDKLQATNPWYYEMQELGFNFRLSDIQCALGLSQLKRVDEFVEKRRNIARFYDGQFDSHEFLRPSLTDKQFRTLSSYHLYVLRIDFNKIKKNRAEVMRHLQNRGVGTQVHYIPLYRQPYYKNLYSYKASSYPNCESYYNEALSIPIYPSMTKSDCRQVSKVINDLIVF